MAGEQAGDACVARRPVPAPATPMATTEIPSRIGEGSTATRRPAKATVCVAPLGRQGGQVDDEEPVGELLDETDERERRRSLPLTVTAR